MRALAPVVLAACGEMASAVPAPDARPLAGDAAAPGPDAAVEDLDLRLEDFASLSGLMTPSGRGYRVANLLGHEAEALAAASSPTGAPFPVGSVVEAQPTEVMVKRRAGFDATTGDWEYFGITLAADGVTPLRFNVRGAEETACYACHAMVSSPKWDFICDHP